MIKNALFSLNFFDILLKSANNALSFFSLLTYKRYVNSILNLCDVYFRVVHLKRGHNTIINSNSNIFKVIIRVSGSGVVNI